MESVDRDADPHTHHDDNAHWSFATRVAHWHSTTQGGALFDFLDIILSALSVVIYVVYTYVAEVSSPPSPLPTWLMLAEYFLASVFTVHLVVSLLSAKQMRRFVFSLPLLVEVLTILPVVVVNEGQTFSLIVKLVRLLRVLRILHTKAAYRWFSTEIKQQLFSIGFTVSSLTIVGASVISVVENDESLWPINRELVDIKHLVGLSWVSVPRNSKAAVRTPPQLQHTHTHAHTNTYACTLL